LGNGYWGIENSSNSELISFIPRQARKRKETPRNGRRGRRDSMRVEEMTPDG
jgi:hypothetical protein